MTLEEELRYRIEQLELELTDTHDKLDDALTEIEQLKANADALMKSMFKA